MNRASSLRRALRRVKAKALRFRRDGPPILIFGLRRGGSTMLADAAAAARGVWFANEPFAVLPGHAGHATKRRMLPPAPHSHFFGLEGEALERFDAYARALLAARLRDVGTCRRTRPALVADRVCLKILNAPWMIERLARLEPAHVLALVRHPAPQALSALRQGWDFPLRAYADRPEALSARLSDREIAAVVDGVRGGDRWTIALLDWAVTARPLLRPALSGLAPLRYEDVVAAPEETVDGVLARRFGLPDRDAMATAIRRPSGSSAMSDDATRDAIRDGDREALLGRWRRELDEDMRRELGRVLELFEVDLYAPDAAA